MIGATVLADSSVWIDHINRADPELAPLLRRRRILMHPMVLGEIALGSIKERAIMLNELSKLPQSAAASHAEVMHMIDRFELHNCGIGYVDSHLLAAVRLVDGGAIWTKGKRLHAQAERLGIAYGQ